MGSKMSKIRKRQTSDFTIINNEILRDSNLSAKAMGIYCYVWSLPDDWRLYITELVNHFKDGEKSIRSGLKELIDNGYVVRTQSRENGRISSWDYEFLQQKQPDCLFVHVENGALLSTNNKKNNYAPKVAYDRFDFREGRTPPQLGFEFHEVVSYYMEWYFNKMGSEHPSITENQINRMANVFSEYDGKDLLEMVRYHFTESSLKTDFNINHFATEGVLQNTSYQVVI